MKLEVEGVSSWADLGLKFRVSVVAGVVGHRFLRPFRSEVTRCCIPCYRILHPRSKQDLGKRDAGMQSTPNRQTPHSRDCVENRSFFGTRNLPRLGSADLIRNPAVKSPRQGQRVVAASASLKGRFSACVTRHGYLGLSVACRQSHASYREEVGATSAGWQ